MIKKTLKVIVIAVIMFIILVVLAGIIVLWPTYFYERDAWSRDMVKQCSGNFNQCIISADQVTNFDWDIIYIFKEALSKELVEYELGFQSNDIDENSKRKVIFVKDNQVVREELNNYNPSERPEKGSTFFNYDQGEPPHYISRDRKNAIFQIKKDGEYFELVPVNVH